MSRSLLVLHQAHLIQTKVHDVTSKHEAKKSSSSHKNLTQSSETSNKVDIKKSKSTPKIASKRNVMEASDKVDAKKSVSGKMVETRKVDFSPVVQSSENVKIPQKSVKSVNKMNPSAKVTTNTIEQKSTNVMDSSSTKSVNKIDPDKVNSSPKASTSKIGQTVSKSSSKESATSYNMITDHLLQCVSSLTAAQDHDSQLGSLCNVMSGRSSNASLRGLISSVSLGEFVKNVDSACNVLPVSNGSTPLLKGKPSAVQSADKSKSEF